LRLTLQGALELTLQSALDLTLQSALDLTLQSALDLTPPLLLGAIAALCSRSDSASPTVCYDR
jgi:hypothetical protein